MTSPLAIWWHPDLRPHTAFNFTPNLRNAMRVASSLVKAFDFSEKNEHQTKLISGASSSHHRLLRTRILFAILP